MQDTMFKLLSQLFPYITCSGMHGHESAFTAPVAVIWHLAWDLSTVIVSVLPERGSVKINMGGGTDPNSSGGPQHPCLRVAVQKGELKNLPLVTRYLTTQENVTRRLNK